MTPQQKIEKIVDSLEPAIRRAFLAAVEDIKSEAQLRVVVGHLEAGNIELALDALNLRAEFFAPLDDALRAAYMQGGMEALGLLPALASPFGGRAVIRFDGRNERAENYLRDHSSKLVQEIVEDQRQGVREALTEGMEAGQNPRQVALSIVGRQNRLTGRREGGIVGLHSQQMRWVRNMRAELTDPDAMANYLTRKKRDKRFDHIVKKAMAEGKPVSQADIDKLARRYEDRLLKYRGDVIARTEAISSFANAQWEGLEQQVESGVLDRRDIQIVWLAADDSRTRDSHNALDDQRRTFGDYFVSPVTGVRLRFPHDDKAIGTMRNVASETIQCRCSFMPRIAYEKRLRRARENA